MVALLILACSKLSFAERSGRVLVAAYWILPTRPRSACRSASVTGVSGESLRSRLMSMDGISSTYCV